MALMGGEPVKVLFDELLEKVDLNVVIPSAFESLFVSAPTKQHCWWDETWEIGDVRRHWMLLSHCEYLLFPCQYPVLAFPSSMGGYLWHRHCADARPQAVYLKDVARCVTGAMRDLCVHKPQLDQIIFCDTLLNINLLDLAARRSFMCRLMQFFNLQSGLLMVSLENARLERAEGIGLLLALGRGSGKSIERLYLWKLFRQDQNPIALDDTPYQYRGQGAFKTRVTCSICFEYALSHFEALTVLGMNYAYLASNDGQVLLTVASVHNGNLRTLQILCLEEEVPDKLRAHYHMGGFFIPDWAWRKALETCPNLQVHLIICCIPTYDLISRFLSRSMPVSHFHLWSGIDLLCQQPWRVDTTIKLLQTWYPKSLEWISLHFWRNREVLDSTLFGILNKFYNLHGLEFIGLFDNIETVARICAMVNKELECLCLRAQETSSTDNSYLRQRLQEITNQFRGDFLENGIYLDLSTYRM